MNLQKIYKKENIITINSEDTLAHALMLLRSSHDAAFVVDDKKLMGIINPYYCIIKKSYPANTKAKHCMIRPPHIDINFSLKKVIQLMIETKIHYLPVFSKEDFFGIISARRILSSIKDAPELKIPIRDFIKSKQKVISIFEKDTLAQAVSEFKKHKISKLIVLSPDMKLKGVLAYYDLINYLANSKSGKKSGKERGIKDGKKTPAMKQFVKNFMKSSVITLTEDHMLSDAANDIIQKKIGSIIVVDSQKHPIGIITSRDLLGVYARQNEKNTVEIITKELSQKSKNIVAPFINQIVRRFNKVSDQSKIPGRMKIVVQEKKEGGVFKAIVSIARQNHITVIKREGKNLLKLLNVIREKIKR